MTTYALFTSSYGSNHANLSVKITEASTGIPALVMASSTGGILNSQGNATLDSSGNLSVYLDNSKTFTVRGDAFLLPSPGFYLLTAFSRTTAQLAGTPSSSDIAAGPSAEFFDSLTPNLVYKINQSGTNYVPIFGSGSGSSTLSTLVDMGTYDLGTNNPSVAAIKATANAAVTSAALATTNANVTAVTTTANAAIPTTQKGAASGVATLDGTVHIPAAQIPAPTATTLGGVQSTAAVAHQYIASISTAGVPVLAQPSSADLSDLAAAITTPLAAKVATSSIGVTGGVAPNGDTIQVTANVVISVGNANAATYNGKTLEFTGTFSVTVGAGLPANFGFAYIPPTSGTATIVSDGTTTFNGSTTTISRTPGSVVIGGLVQRNSNQNQYVVQ